MFRDDHDMRARFIPALLKGYDAVVLQEAFSDDHRDRILAALVDEYPHNTGQFGPNEFFSHNGGIIILSKWPIVRKARLIFDGCEGSDCMVKKGVAYVELVSDGVALHLFGLHLQAQQEYAASRVAQFPQVRQFIEAQDIDASELVLVAGDFNVDYFARSRDGEFDMLTESLGLVLPERAPAASYDHLTNSYVTDPVSERLDYIFYSARHLVPTQASNKVLHFREAGMDLSDHHPVVGRFQLDGARD